MRWYVGWEQSQGPLSPGWPSRSQQHTHCQPAPPHGTPSRPVWKPMECGTQELRVLGWSEVAWDARALTGPLPASPRQWGPSTLTQPARGPQRPPKEGVLCRGLGRGQLQCPCWAHVTRSRGTRAGLRVIQLPLPASLPTRVPQDTHRLRTQPQPSCPDGRSGRAWEPHNQTQAWSGSGTGVASPWHGPRLGSTRAAAWSAHAPQRPRVTEADGTPVRAIYF